MEAWSEPYGATHDGGMADADLSHMGDGVMDTWLWTMALSMDGPNCRVGADNVPKPRRLELVSGDSVTCILFLILLLSNSTQAKPQSCQ
jgi:hypothetical protein